MSGPITARLEAVRLDLEHEPMFERLWGDPRVGQTLGGIRDARQVHDVLVEGMEHWERHGFGRWVLLAGDRPVGTVKLARWWGRGMPEVELGYALLPETWGLGYATEAGTGAIEHARSVLGLTDVVAFTLPQNQPSLAVLQRLGFKGGQPLVLGGREHVLCHRHLAPVPQRVPPTGRATAP